MTDHKMFNSKKLRLNVLKSIDLDEVENFVREFNSCIAGVQKRLRDETVTLGPAPDDNDEDKFWRQERLADDLFELEEILKLSWELAIVAVYKKIEIKSKRAIVVAYPDASTEEHKLFNIKKMKEYLAAKGVLIETLPNYRAMDELRCLNNSIKHGGVVNNELAKYSGWTDGANLANIDQAYQRLAPLGLKYIQELIGAIIANIL